MTTAWIPTNVAASGNIYLGADLQKSLLNIQTQTQALHRDLQTDTMKVKYDQKADEKDAKADYNDLQKEKPDITDQDARAKWSDKVSEVQLIMQEELSDIKDYYETEMQLIEAEATDEQSFLDHRKNQIEAEYQATNADRDAEKQSAAEGAKSNAIQL